MKALRAPHLLDVDGRRLRYSYSTEADLRDVIAAVAHAAGWDVQTEVEVKGWGRIDVLISHDSTLVVVEVKKKLATDRHMRLGLQQAYGYAEAMGRSQPDGLLVLPFLVGGEVSESCYRFAGETAFAAVRVKQANRFLDWLMLESPGRAEVALDRLRLAQHEVKVRKAAYFWTAPQSAVERHPDEVFAELLAEFPPGCLA